MSYRDLRRYQEMLLVHLLRHAHDNLSFYRSRLDALFRGNGDVDLSRWNEVPILRRDEVSLHAHKMRVPQLPAGYGGIRNFQTSGSTGAPLDIASNALVSVASNALLTRLARWFGLDNSRPLAMIRLFTNDPAPPGLEGRVSPTISPEMPAVVADQAMTSRSQASMANKTRRSSPLRQ